MRKIRWKNSPPYCWQATIDGLIWRDLRADDDEDSSAAVDEAAERFGGRTNEWEVLEEPHNPSPAE